MEANPFPLRLLRRGAPIYLAATALQGRTGHAAGRELLAQLYGRVVGQPLPPIAIAPRGKPYFPEGGWHFSISHTPGHAFCALAQCPMGLDAEELTRKVPLKLADKILSPGERAQLDAAGDKNRALLTFWVLKEADAKRTGQGLQGYPNHTDFSLDDTRVLELEGCLVAVLCESDTPGERIEKSGGIFYAF